MTDAAEPEFYTPVKDLAGLDASVRRDPTLPDVLIIGDSISIGYMQPVVSGLRGKANVARPNTNCGNTSKGLAQLEDWLGDVSWSVIHFNFGLHDLCYRNPESEEQGHRDKVNGVRDVEPEDYRRNLGTLLDRLQQTGATLIFATTTVVPEGEAGRFVGDELKYNQIAREVLVDHDVTLNDLHALSASFAPEFFVAPGNVHYTPEGSARLGAQVVAMIEARLPESD
jgi:hypothetical protein